MNVLLADDHPLFRRGLKQLLAEACGAATIGEAEDARETLAQALGGDWDLVLLDINLPDRSGLEVLAELKRRRRALPVLVLSAYPESEYAVRSLRLGAAGFLTKQGAADELVAAVRKVLAGGCYVSPAVAEQLAASVAQTGGQAPHQALSEREFEVLRLVATGKTLKEIAAHLCLGEKTIGTHHLRLLRKLDLRTDVELTRYALQHRLVD
jgi:DNA-binding NarL/FixJ family response regulator